MADDALHALKVSESRYRRLFETARDGILLLNATTGQIEDVNPFLTELLGYTYEHFLGKKLWELGAFVDVLESKSKFAELQTVGYVRYDDLPLRTYAGQKIEVEFVSNSYDCEGTTVIQCNIRDITARKQAEAKIKELAFFDTLTHLPNRTLLQDRLQKAMVGSSRTGNHCALLFIDLDHFKTLNDTLGHDKGDMLLQLVAQRLCLCVREGDTVARLGGDEFVVVLENLNTSFGEATQQTKDIAEKILSALQGNYRLGELDHHSTASVGAAVFLGTNSPTEELLKQADLAMYKSKERGRNRMQFFDPAMQSLVEDRARLEAELRTAIAQGQIML